VRTAATVDEARALIADRAPTLVLLDFMLASGATSETLLVELLGRPPPSPALLVYSATSAALPVAKRHGVRFLPKPFDLDDLLSTIRELLLGAATP
jgi:DNA-binding NtrC family response regulator